MSTSFSVVCYKSKTLKNGENPLMLQVSKNGKRQYKSLGVGKAAVVCPPRASFIDPLRQNMIDPLRQNKNDP